MPRNKTTKAAEKAAASMPQIPAELIEKLAEGPMTAQTIEQASMALKKALIERALAASCRITWVTGWVRASLKRPATIAMAAAARRC